MSVVDAESIGTGFGDVVEEAKALRPLLERERLIGDQQRRLTDETVRALEGAGLLRMMVPRRFGGMESALRTAIDATGEIAKGDPSAGWVVMILGSGHWVTGLYPEIAQQEVYADGPDTRICAVFTPHSTARRVDGGWLISGKWAPSSGCLHSRWAILGFPMAGQDDAPGGLGFALVPLAQLHTEDIWFTVGMRATGSNMLIGEDLFVPDHRVLPVGPAVEGNYPSERTDIPRYRSALMPTLATYMIAPYLGIASGALELVVEQAGKRGISFTNYETQAESTAFQLAIAECSAKVDVVRLLAHQSADVVDGHAAAGTYPDYLTRARIRLHTGHAVQQCREVVDSLVSAYGASALSESHPLGGFMRDVHTAARHAVANPAMNSELFGRALLGVQPNITELI